MNCCHYYRIPFELSSANVDVLWPFHFHVNFLIYLLEMSGTFCNGISTELMVMNSSENSIIHFQFPVTLRMNECMHLIVYHFTSTPILSTVKSESKIERGNGKERER